ncbi:MAG TPA: tripartite tricarboxylate transporter substrate-binding protein [Candidatus Binatia bacterium]|jgi:tripartite-type tricarboxylate transporter receptor subunit TctC|nr:tripartite tricarboxylate transporter substrate-binding protein [Candidatus Binatia bacterium]
MKIGIAAVISAALMLLFEVVPNSAVAADFYAGKTIRVTVGLAPGGGYDTYARIVARHMGKHVPGNPSFVVDNMEGAGSLVAANYTYTKADRDGTFIGVWNSAYVLYQALGDRAVRLDAKKLNWIGAPIKGSPSCNIMGFTGLKTMDEVVKSGRELKMGSTRAGSTYNDLPMILNKTVGTKFNVINGYKGTSVITVAMRSKELDGGCWGWESARVTARAMLDAQGDQKLIPILVHSKWEDKELKNVPLARDYIKAKAGDAGVQLYNAWIAQYEFQRPWVMPPGVPQDRVETLRKAFKATLEDPEFVAEAKKSKLEIQYVSAEEIGGLVNQILSISPKTKKELQFLVKKETTASKK